MMRQVFVVLLAALLFCSGASAVQTTGADSDSVAAAGSVADGVIIGRVLLVERERDIEKQARRDAAKAAKRAAQDAKRAAKRVTPEQRPRVRGGAPFTPPTYLGPTPLSGTPASRCPAGIIPHFKPCCIGFEGGAIALKCEAGSICTRKNGFYGACATPERRATVIAEQGWEGTTLECGEDMAKGCKDRMCQPS